MPVALRVCAWMRPRGLWLCCHVEEVANGFGKDIVLYQPSVLWLKILAGAQIRVFFLI